MFFFNAEHNTCLEMYVSSSLETSVSFKSKLLLYFCFGEGAAAANGVVEELENLLLGLRRHPGDNVGAVNELLVLNSGTLLVRLFSLKCFSGRFRIGPLLVSSGNGWSEL